MTDPVKTMAMLIAKRILEVQGIGVTEVHPWTEDDLRRLDLSGALDCTVLARAVLTLAINMVAYTGKVDVFELADAGREVLGDA